MDLKLVKNLLDLISKSEVDEVSIEEGDFKIKIKKNADPKTREFPLYHYQMPLQPGESTGKQSAPPAPSPEPVEAGETKADEAEGDLVRSPIVGTFYRSSSPDTEPFVEIGDHIEKGSTLCIVEAMKIMNEIEAEFSGTVQKILAGDSQPVEYDQPLFIIKKD